MNGFNDFELWRQRCEVLLREVEMSRLTKAAWSRREKKPRRIRPRTGRELRRYAVRLSRFLSSLRQMI